MTDLDLSMLERAYERALALEKAGHIEDAAQAWREVLDIDPTDCCGAAMRLAALERGETPERAPPAYVMTLFDQHADAFEAILVDQLGYDVPNLIRTALDALPARGSERPYPRLLDLGCGTGLVAEALEDVTAHRTGIDLSEAMVAAAGEHGLYDDLYVGDVEAFLDAAGDETWDLITAADVLPYLGALEKLFARIAACLSPGGLFATSTETLPAGQIGACGYRVGPRQRFAHDRDYVARALERAGLALASCEPITVRNEDGVPVPGHLVVAMRAGR